MSVVAVDQGTTSTKALLIEDDGASRLLGSFRHEQILPRAGLGRARRRRAARQCARSDRARRRGRRNVGRARQSGRDGRRLGQGRRHAALQRHRLAGPAHAGRGRCAPRGRPRGRGHRALRPAARCVFLGQQAALDPRQRSARARARAQWPPRSWHQRQLLHSPAHRPLRHRRHDGRAHLADEPRHLRVGRAARRTVRRAARPAARDRRVRSAGRRAVGRRPHRHARRRDRRSGGLALRPWLPRARRPQGDLRHRRLRADDLERPPVGAGHRQHRGLGRRRRTGPMPSTAASTPPAPQSSGSCASASSSDVAELDALPPGPADRQGRSASSPRLRVSPARTGTARRRGSGSASTTPPAART